MAKQENAVMYAVGQVCRLYCVDLFRMQSRVTTVPGAAGRDRPMFFGKWKDKFGNEHFGGMADFLARPRVPVANLLADHSIDGGKAPTAALLHLVTVPLWIETKATKGEETYDQLAFAQHVRDNGETYISVRESLDPLVDWFQSHGIREGGR